MIYNYRRASCLSYVHHRPPPPPIQPLAATSVKRARKQQFWQVNYSCAAFDFDKRSVLLAVEPSPQMVRARECVCMYMCVLLSKAASCVAGGTSKSTRGYCCRGREDEKARLCPDSRPLGSLFSRGGNTTIHHCLSFLLSASRPPSLAVFTSPLPHLSIHLYLCAFYLSILATIITVKFSTRNSPSA